MAESLASVVTQVNQPLEVQRLPIPELEPTALLARVDAATLCGTDVHIWQGHYPGIEARMPLVLGHEASGTIAEIRGERRDLLGDPLQVGDRVIWAYPFCRHCYYCTIVNQPTLCRNCKLYGRERSDRPPYLLGGCAEYHYVPPGADVIRVPENVSPELAASASCALRTIMHGVERLGPVASHESVLVQGCGPVGLYAAAVLQRRGVHRLLVAGAPAERLSVASEWGADATLNLDELPDRSARRDWVLEQTSGRGPDIVFQCAGTQAIPEALDLVRPGGRVVSIGVSSGDVTVPGHLVSTKYVTLIGIVAAVGRHYYQAVQFLAANRDSIPFDQLFTGRYTLDQVTPALQAMAEFREVKPVIVPKLA